MRGSIATFLRASGINRVVYDGLSFFGTGCTCGLLQCRYQRCGGCYSRDGVRFWLKAHDANREKARERVCFEMTRGILNPSRMAGLISEKMGRERPWCNHDLRY